jgi:ergothioneine biosynthesis protein EgtB
VTLAAERPSAAGFLEWLAARFREVRGATLRLAEPLSEEDCVVQSMPDASPTKWHLAHTTWFFETFVLESAQTAFQPFDRAYRVLFNSYYNGIGEQFSRPERGLLSRPSLAEVLRYREHVDAAVLALLAEQRDDLAELASLIETGLHHEQQHQELVLTDLKHAFSRNPTHPVYRDTPRGEQAEPAALGWYAHPGGLEEIGAHPGAFHFDNEGPRHRVFVEAFELATRPVSCAEYIEFMADDGYERPELWLSEGWALLGERDWRAPLYWQEQGGAWHELTLGGLRPVKLAAPVCHVSYFEADAFASWMGARLPSEAEWELAAVACGDEDAVARGAGNFVEDGWLHPRAEAGGASGTQPVQLFGDVWEWTRSAYGPYPGFAPPAGALGEYNGKFMCNQWVLRGGSCATPRSHIRASYRNFFPADARWQFSGLRLARDAR